MTKKIKIEEEKTSVIPALRRLLNSTGWAILVESLEEDIKEAEERLHGDKALLEGQTIENWMLIRKDRLKLINMPKNLIKEELASGKGEDPTDDLDPYE